VEEWAPAKQAYTILEQLPKSDGFHHHGHTGPAQNLHQQQHHHLQDKPSSDVQQHLFSNGNGIMPGNHAAENREGGIPQTDARHKGFGALAATLLDTPTENATSSKNKTGDSMWASPWETSPFATTSQTLPGTVARDEASVRPPWDTTVKTLDEEPRPAVPQDTLSASQLRATSVNGKSARSASTAGGGGSSTAGGGGGKGITGALAQADDKDLVSQLMWENSSLLRRVEVQANALIEMSVEKERSEPASLCS
jgi:hypothetical protein